MGIYCWLSVGSAPAWLAHGCWKSDSEYHFFSCFHFWSNHKLCGSLYIFGYNMRNSVCSTHYFWVLSQLHKRSQNHIVNKHYPIHVWTEEIKPSTNSRSVEWFDFLDLLSFRFIYIPHRLVNYMFSYNYVAADSKKICVCRWINARSCVKRVLEATLTLYLYTRVFSIGFLQRCISLCCPYDLFKRHPSIYFMKNIKTSFYLYHVT